MARSLDRLTVTGYKSIREMTDLRLQRLNVLIGANGSGKTNLISIFRLLNQIVESNLQRFVGQSGGADALLYFGQKVTDRIGIELHFGPNGYSCQSAPAASDALIFGEETCWYHDDLRYPRPFTVDLGAGHKETALHAETQKPEKQDRSARSGCDAEWRVYHFHDTSRSAGVNQAGDLNDNGLVAPGCLQSGRAACIY